MNFDTNYLQVIEEIIDILNKNDESDHARIIASIKNGATTGGELLGAVTHELLALVRTNAKLNNLVGERVQKLKAICGMYGMNVW